MRKAALQLLVAMLMYNPFGGELPLELFANSLQEYSNKLKVTLCCLLVPYCCEFPTVWRCKRVRTGPHMGEMIFLGLHLSNGATAYMKLFARFQLALIDLASAPTAAVLLAGACPT